MNATQAPQAQEIHTRFLYPFLFERGQAAAFATALQGLTIATKTGEAPVWQPGCAPDAPNSDAIGKSPRRALSVRYADELLPTVRGFLFPDSEVAGCHHLQADEQARPWFHNRVAVHFGGQAPFSVLLDVPNIELFLSPYGAGVLSIALSATAQQWPDADAGIPVTELKRFNYHLAQIRRPGTVPVLAIPHPWDDPATKEKLGDKVAAPPAEDAELSQRLGSAGGRFTLSELLDWLLSPVAGTLGFTPTREQLGVYSVARFGAEVDFSDPVLRDHLGPLLAGLAQVEEPDHAGALPGAPLDLPNHLMNTRQWVAVGTLGAVHLVADQHQPARGFDSQRVTQYRDKYFIPYLLALLQRLSLQRGADDAARAISGDVHQRREAFHRLHGDLLDFAVAGHYTEVSSRHSVNRFYRVAQQGLGVDPALATVSNAVRSHEERQLSEETRQLGDQTRRIGAEMAANVRVVSHVQRKIEWLEIFFVSFYAAELVNLLSEHSFSHYYSVISVITAALLGGLVAALGLKPWNPAPNRVHDSGNKRRRVIVVSLLALVALVALAAWLTVGFLYFPLAPGH